MATFFTYINAFLIQFANLEYTGHDDVRKGNDDVSSLPIGINDVKKGTDDVAFIILILSRRVKSRKEVMLQYI